MLRRAVSASKLLLGENARGGAVLARHHDSRAAAIGRRRARLSSATAARQQLQHPARRPPFRAAQQGRAVAPAQLTVRRYRGEAGEPEPVLSEHEEALLQAAKPRSDDILRRHFALPDPSAIPASSWGPAPPPPPEGSAPPHQSSAASANIMDDVRRKRLVYRSKQRGWLEVDLLLGTWASANVPSLTAAELDEFEAFVNLETIDIYNIITLRIDIPDEVRSSVVERIQAWARDSPLGRADPAAYEKAKADANLV